MPVHTLPDPHGRPHLLPQGDITTLQLWSPGLGRDPHLKTDGALELGFPEGCVYLVLRLLALPALLVQQHLLQQLVELVEGVDLGTRAK